MQQSPTVAPALPRYTVPLILLPQPEQFTGWRFFFGFFFVFMIPRLISCQKNGGANLYGCWVSLPAPYNVAY